MKDVRNLGGYTASVYSIPLS